MVARGNIFRTAMVDKKKKKEVIATPGFDPGSSGL